MKSEKLRSQARKPYSVARINKSIIKQLKRLRRETKDSTKQEMQTNAAKVNYSESTKKTTKKCGQSKMRQDS